MISEHIKRNTYYTFVFNLSDSESVYAALRHLQINERCARMLSSLLPGMCIFRQTQASWSSAFWCRIDYVEPARNIGQIKYDKHSFVPAITNEQTDKIIEQLYDIVSQHKTDIKRQAGNKSSESDRIPMKLLQLGAANPHAPVARLFEQFGKIRFEAQIAIRKTLEDKGLALFEEIRIGRFNMLLMEITDKGYRSLRLPVPTGNKGRGSIAHRHFAHWIKLHFEDKGCKAYLEWVVPQTNHPVDVAVHLGNGWKCFEICNSSFGNLLSHIKQCFENSNAVESLVIIAATKTKLKEIKKLVQSNLIFTMYADKIEFVKSLNHLAQIKQYPGICLCIPWRVNSLITPLAPAAAVGDASLFFIGSSSRKEKNFGSDF